MLTLFYILNFLLVHYKFLSTTNILQKQYYSVKRYMLFLKDQKVTIYYKLVGLLSIFLTLIHPAFCFLFLLSYVEKFKNKIIKFKMTKRVVRQFIILEILNISFLILGIIFKDLIHISLSILIYAFIYWISFILSLFIEKFIQKRNIIKAQTKLKEYKTKIIAITGSYGKTSLKNYIYELIKDKYNVLVTSKSYNTLNGILLTINNLLMPYHQYLILEIGVDQKGGMNKFVKHFKFDIGVVTAIGNQHLKTFKSVYNIFKEKIKLLYNCKECVIINNDDPYLSSLSFEKNSIGCSIFKQSNIYLNRINHHTIDIYIDGNEYTSKYYLLGKHNLSNLSLAIGVAKALKIEDSHIIKNIENLRNITHRLSISTFKNWTIIDDSYNSNSVGFINALEELSLVDNFKVLITPGIIENIDANKLLIEQIDKCSDLALIIGNTDDFKTLKNKLFFNSFIEAINYLKTNYSEQSITILIENDIPDIYLR